MLIAYQYATSSSNPLNYSHKIVMKLYNFIQKLKSNADFKGILLKFVHFKNTGTNADFKINFTKSLAGASSKATSLRMALLNPV